MMDEVYKAIAHASSGYVEAPAGCGKTEAIVKTVGNYCSDPQLILTHTHAGVGALRQRFKDHQVPTNRFHVDTIAGWSWGWVRKYPQNSTYQGSIDFPEWDNVYGAMSKLLQKDFVKQVIYNSYSGVIVDEYQDCTISMHQLIISLGGILPCRVLGDPLQGIFGFRQEPLIDWSDVKNDFSTDLGKLDIPYRWIKADNETLGRWLLETRSDFLQNLEPDFRHSPVEVRTVEYRNLGAQLIGLTHQKQGRVCVIGPKAMRLPTGIETTLVKHKYRILEPNELTALKNLIHGLSENSMEQKSEAAVKFLFKAYGGFGSGEKPFIEKILKGENQNPKRADRTLLCQNHTNGTTLSLLLAILEYIELQDGVSCKLRESLSALKCILEKHIDTGEDLKSLYADEITRRKQQARGSLFRCTGSTLLMKGLEFDHTIIVRGKNWGTHKDLYVALTRGSKSVTLLNLN